MSLNPIFHPMMSPMMAGIGRGSGTGNGIKLSADFITGSILSGTFTRASTSPWQDSDGNLRLALIDQPVYPGRRLSGQNYLMWSEDFSNAVWVAGGTATVDGTNTLNFPAEGGVVTQPRRITVSTGGATIVNSGILSGSGTIHLEAINALGTFSLTAKLITLTDTPTRYDVSGLMNDGALGYQFRIRRQTGDTATQVTVTNAQLEQVATGVTTPRDYVKTTDTAPVNVTSPYDINGDPIPNLLGLQSTPDIANKCQTFGFIPDDELGAELVTVADDREFISDTGYWNLPSGSAISGGTLNFDGTAANPNVYHVMGTLGRCYSITYTVTSISSQSVRVLMGATPGIARTTPGTYTEIIAKNSGATFGIQALNNAICSIDNVSVKEVKYAVGTKSFHDGTAFIQNIDGMTLSGDVAGVLSIEQDTAALDAAGYGGPERNGKKLTLYNGLGVALAEVAFSGIAGNVNAHSVNCVYKSDGTTRLFTAGIAGSDISAVIDYALIHKLVPTPSSTGYATLRANAGTTVDFLLPGLYEQSYAPYLPVPANSLISSTTQARTSLIYTYPAGSRRVKIPYTHWGLNSGVAKCIWSDETDDANYWGIFIDGTLAYIEKMVAGVSEITSLPLSPTQLQKYEFDAGFNADNTMFISVDGVVHTVDGSTTLAPVISGTMELGSLGGASNADGFFESVKLLRS